MRRPKAKKEKPIRCMCEFYKRFYPNHKEAEPERILVVIPRPGV